jgi:hypothetical protein
LWNEKLAEKKVSKTFSSKTSFLWDFTDCTMLVVATIIFLLQLSDKIIAKFPLLEYVRVGAFTLPQFAKLEHLRVMHMPIVDYSKMKAKAAVESAKEEDKEALNQIIARGRLEVYLLQIFS